MVTKLAITETQKRLLDLMKRVDAFLSEQGIEYYLFGGSLIGAIRHHGFIPWDDDIDIFMKRENYYRLVNLSEQLPWDDIAFDCYEKNSHFRRPFGMFTFRKDTRYVKSRVFNRGAGMGTGIDVFVMDNVPRDHLNDYLKHSLLYQEMLTDAVISNKQIAEIGEDYFACCDRADTAGRDQEVRRLIGELEKYAPPKREDLQVVRLWARKPRIYEADMLGIPVRYPFEDTEFPVPQKPEACLRMQYGFDWYLLPEKTDQNTHAFRIDFELSSNNYFNAIDSGIDWSKADEILKTRKREEIKILKEKNRVAEYYREITEVSRLLQSGFDAWTADNAMEHYRNRRYEEFIMLMEPAFRYRDILAEGFVPAGVLSEELIGAWAESLLMAGRYYDADRILNTFSVQSDQRTIEALKETLGTVFSLAEAWQDRNPDQMEKSLQVIPCEKWGMIPDCIMALWRITLSGWESPFCPSREELLKMTGIYLGVFPHNYDIIRIRGELEADKGNTELAEQLFREVLDRSRNGLDVLELAAYR